MHRHLTTESAFWQWFLVAEPRFRDLNVPTQEELLDELLARLHQYCDLLYFEIGGPPGGPVELVLSAGGSSKAVPCVRSLASSAPPIPGWRVVPFKPAQGFAFRTEHGEASLAPQECWFHALPGEYDPSKHIIRVACPGFTMAALEDFCFAVWTALDTALGELVVAQRIEEIQVVPIPARPGEAGFRPLPELEAFLRSEENRGA